MKNSNEQQTFRLPKTVNVVMIKSDGLTYTFQTDSWVKFAERALAEYDDNLSHIREGHVKSRYSKIFYACGDNDLTQTSFRELREELANGNIPEGPFKTVTVD